MQIILERLMLSLLLPEKPLLSLYAAGHISGCSVNIGHGR